MISEDTNGLIITYAPGLVRTIDIALESEARKVLSKLMELDDALLEDPKARHMKKKELEDKYVRGLETLLISIRKLAVLACDLDEVTNEFIPAPNKRVILGNTLMGKGMSFVKEAKHDDAFRTVMGGGLVHFEDNNEFQLCT